MTEHPIIFTAESVRAILAGTKTQTRRLVTPQPEPFGSSSYGGTRQGWVWQRSKRWSRSWNDDDKDPYGRVNATFAIGIEGPYGRRGDRLWAKEGWRATEINETVYYRADEEWNSDAGWRSPLFMPRRASRITLEVVDIRVQRLHEISEEDAIAEGVAREAGGKFWLGGPHRVTEKGHKVFYEARTAYADIWDSINGKRAPWRSNPWVWAITFRRLA